MTLGKIIIIMKIEEHVIECVKHETDINYFMLLLRQYVAERAMYVQTYNIVELGVRTGNSTISFLSGLTRANNGKLFSCDIDPCEHAISYINSANLSSRWEFTQIDSISYADLYKDTIDLVFIDTDHTYELTKKELEIWSPKLKNGGRIILHDTLSRPDGVGIAVKEFAEKNKDWKYYNIDVCCGLGIFDKP
jgi:predicted O-methyltransferase YrrM